jgi:hypothetical protein
MSARQIMTPDLAAPVPVAAGEDLAVSEARTVTVELRGPDSPRWEVVS